MRATGSTNLPLHGGRVPAWLGERMQRMGRVVVEAILLEYGRDELIRRLAHPFWFQCFGAVMGMDWHSSGITTSVIGALKRGLAPIADEIGVHVLGGRGRHSRKTPEELIAVSERLGLDGAKLADTSKLVAKVDSAAVQDGYALYLHGFVLAADGKWAVVQQGMSPASKMARRYHWLSEQVSSFVDAPHAAIEGRSEGEIVNLVDARASAARAASVALAASGPDVVLRALPREVAPQLSLPAHHEVLAEDVQLRRLAATLRAAAERGPKDYADLLLTPGVGARTVLTLAMVAEVVHGAPHRFTDPARFSLALGGKDRHPFPVPLRVYDRTIGVLRDAVDRAKLGNEERMAALRRLDAEARRVDLVSAPADFDGFVEEERDRSHAYGGMSVFGPEPPRARRAPARRPKQLDLFGAR